MSTKERIMPFWDHVVEFRNRMLIVAAVGGLFAVGGYIFFPSFIRILYPIIGEDLYVTGIAEGFLMRVEASVICGIFLSLPLFFSQISFFMAPALSAKQRFILLLGLCVSLTLFIGGIVFAFKTVLPLSIVFLKADAFFPENVNRLISFSDFLRFFFQFLLGFGLFFEFPVALMLLMGMKVITPINLLKKSKILIPLIFFISAVLTPPDVVSQVLLAAPMVALYYVCIAIGFALRLG